MKRRIAFGLYAGLLLLTHTWAPLSPSREKPVAVDTIAIAHANGERGVLAYRESGDPRGPVLLLLHGSPGGSDNFDQLRAQLPSNLRCIAVDMPGFGFSTPDPDGFSIVTHAKATLGLLDRLNIDRAHVVGFSMGGGVALSMIDLAPQRVVSLTLLAGLGVQELELLGNYTLNHAVHGISLAGAWVMENAVPHLGKLQGWPLGMAYACNFYQTDQRPLRGILERLEIPTLILHGREDPLVPYSAAVEHARVVPHARLVTYESDHFLVWNETEAVARDLNEFVAQVESGTAPRRIDASAERVARASLTYAQAGTARRTGIAVVVLLLVLVLGTFLAEDLTCISAGLAVAYGQISWGQAVGACFFGIFFGDMMLYGLGRWLRRGHHLRAPLSWFVHEDRLNRAANWFERRGWMAIVLSRFLPGTRLPTYVAAGALRANFWLFTLYFFLAVAIWTPAVVSLASWLGASAIGRWETFQRVSVVLILAVLVATFVLMQIVVPLFTWRGRRDLVARWRRFTRWEFWPAWAFYPPLVVYVAGLALRHRSLTVVTAVNPAIHTGGLVGESKASILAGLSPHPAVAAWALLDSSPHESRVARLQEFMTANSLDYPIVLKPDVGERGRGVRIVDSSGQATDVLRSDPQRLIAQEYVGGAEYGVFYVRHPDQAHGRIISVTHKVMPHVIGDGSSDLETLILRDERAVIMANEYFRANAGRLAWVPDRGESVKLVDLGTHCLGAVFLDGNHLITPDLTAAVDEMSRGFEGFFFGRYDLRVPDEASLQAGQGLKVMELNGLTSEATHIYDPRHSWWVAQRTLRRQWSLAFSIAVANRARGTVPTSWRTLWPLLRDHLRGKAAVAGPISNEPNAERVHADGA